MAVAVDDPREYVSVGDNVVIDREELWERLVQSLLEFKDQKRHFKTFVRRDGVIELPPRRGRKPGGGLTPNDVLDHIQALKDAGEKVNRPALARHMSCSLSHCKRLTRAAGLHGYL